MDSQGWNAPVLRSGDSMDFPVLRSGTDYWEDPDDAVCHWDTSKPMVVHAVLLRDTPWARDGTTVVVKYFRDDLMSTLSELAHVLMISVFPHPNVLHCFPVVCLSADQRPGLMMPLGEPLATWDTDDRLRHNIVKRPSSALEVVCDVLQGVAFLHSAGVTHGDLHAGNVLWYDGHWRIFDFGHSSSSKTFQRTANKDAAFGDTPTTPEQELNPQVLLQFIGDVQLCALSQDDGALANIKCILEEGDSLTPLSLFFLLKGVKPQLTATDYGNLHWHCYVGDGPLNVEHISDHDLCRKVGVTQSTMLHLALQAAAGFERVEPLLNVIQQSSRCREIVNARDVFGVTPLMILAMSPEGRTDQAWIRVRDRLLCLGANRLACTVFPGFLEFSFDVIEFGVWAGYAAALLRETGISDEAMVKTMMGDSQTKLRVDEAMRIIPHFWKLLEILSKGGGTRVAAHAETSAQGRAPARGRPIYGRERSIYMRKK